MRFCYFPEHCLTICETSVDFVLVIKCFSLFAAVCIVESVGRVYKDVFDVVTNILSIFLRVSILQLIADLQESFIEVSLLSMTI